MIYIVAVGVVFLAAIGAFYIRQLLIDGSRFHVLFEHSADAHLILWQDAIIDCNLAAVKMLNCKNKTQLLSFHPAIFSPEIQPDGKNSLEKSVEMDRIAVEKGFHRFEWVHKKLDGTDFPVEVSINPINFRGRHTLLVVWHDLTERKIAEKKMQEAAQAKADFLANMSHEIRTPLNGILSLADILSESNLDDSQRKYIDLIQYAGDGLLTIINDVLDFSKIEADKLEIEEIPFSIRTLLDSTVQLLLSRAEEKGILLEFEVDPQIPKFVIGDRNRIGQVLLNLVGNAVKFTKKGSVRIEVIIQQMNEGKSTALMFKVVDTGMGMEADFLSNIFTPFSQADSSTSRKFGGTGLGLSISKRLIALMKGDIFVCSEVGKGSTFSFHIPLILGEEIADRESKDDSIRGDVLYFNRKLKDSRILIVEDNATNKLILQKILKKFDLSCFSVSDGKEAVDFFMREKIDVILMDCQMPILNGYEATKEIRKLEEKMGTRTPIIALTANAFKEDIEKCLEVGMDDFVSKPIKKEALLIKLGNWINISEKKEEFFNKKKNGNNHAILLMANEINHEK